MSLAGHAGQIESTNAGEIRSEFAALQKDARVFPFVLAALDEIVKCPAAPPGWEDELFRQSPGRQSTPGGRNENDAIEVAIGSLCRVRPVAARAYERHTTYPDY